MTAILCTSGFLNYKIILLIPCLQSVMYFQHFFGKVQTHFDTKYISLKTNINLFYQIKYLLSKNVLEKVSIISKLSRKYSKNF